MFAVNFSIYVYTTVAFNTANWLRTYPNVCLLLAKHALFLKTVRLICVLLECQLGFTFYFNMCHSWINETRKPHYIISVQRVVCDWDSVVFLLITIMGMDAFTFYMLFVKDKDKKKQLQTWVDILIQGYSFLIQC